MNNTVLRFNDWTRMVKEGQAEFYSSHDSLFEADAPIANSIWKNQPMEKYEKYFRYWKGIMRSKVKFEITDVPMATGGKYQGAYDCYVNVMPSQAEGGKDTTSFTLYTGNGTYYVVEVGKEGRERPLEFLKKLLVNAKNLKQSGKYEFKKTGNKLELNHVSKEKDLSYSFDMVPKLLKGWNTAAMAWTKDNPFLDNSKYPNEDSKIKAANEFRAFVKAKFPNVSEELDLSLDRKDSSAYGTSNIMKAWNYIMPESAFALGQLFSVREQPGFEKALASEAKVLNTWVTDILKNKGSKPAEQIKDASIVYTIPGDKYYEYKAQDGKWFSRNKKGGDWVSLASNKVAVDKLNKQFPNANLA